MYLHCTVGSQRPGDPAAATGADGTTSEDDIWRVHAVYQWIRRPGGTTIVIGSHRSCGTTTVIRSRRPGGAAAATSSYREPVGLVGKHSCVV
jgi:hypothetical protein